MTSWEVVLPWLYNCPWLVSCKSLCSQAAVQGKTCPGTVPTPDNSESRVMHHRESERHKFAALPTPCINQFHSRFLVNTCWQSDQHFMHPFFACALSMWASATDAPVCLGSRVPEATVRSARHSQCPKRAEPDGSSQQPLFVGRANTSPSGVASTGRATC